jgi:hypothetical protein
MSTLTGSLIKLSFGVAFIIIAIALGPILGIWSLNTLFPKYLSIPITWETWAAFNILFGASGLIRLGTNRK